MTDNGRTQSVWMDTSSITKEPALAGDEQTDVCIVGSGIAGLTTAYLPTISLDSTGICSFLRVTMSRNSIRSWRRRIAPA